MWTMNEKERSVDVLKIKGLFTLQRFCCNQQLMQCIAINWKFSIFNAMHGICRWSQKNHCSVNEALEG